MFLRLNCWKLNWRTQNFKKGTRWTVYRLVREISYHLPIYLYSNFLKKQESALRFLLTHEKHRIFEKINNLIKKQIYTNIKNTTTMQYHNSLSALNNKLKLTNIKDSSVFPSHPTNSNEGIKINIEPSSFISNIPRSSLISKKQNWLVKLTSTIIPHKVQCLIQFDENFSLPIQNKEKTVVELIKSIECNTNKFDIDTQLTLRNRFIPTINNLPYTRNNLTNQKLHNLIKSSKIFIKNNPHIIFTRADKDNTTIILERNDYNCYCLIIHCLFSLAIFIWTARSWHPRSPRDHSSRIASLGTREGELRVFPSF